MKSSHVGPTNNLSELVGLFEGAADGLTLGDSDGPVLGELLGLLLGLSEGAAD
jgi:hypothetical protein